MHFLVMQGREVVQLCLLHDELGCSQHQDDDARHDHVSGDQWAMCTSAR